jgi:hypothetical protein
MSMCAQARSAVNPPAFRCRLGLSALMPVLLQVWTEVETQDVATLKLRKSGGAPSRMVVVRSRRCCINVHGIVPSERLRGSSACTASHRWDTGRQLSC